MLSCSRVRMSSCTLHTYVELPKTSQPPWKASTRAAGLPRPCWLILSGYVKRVSSTFVGIVTPACAGAWEDEQSVELRHRCSPPALAIGVPDRRRCRPKRLSYGYHKDLFSVTQPKPRSLDTLPMTFASGLLSRDRRNSQG